MIGYIKRIWNNFKTICVLDFELTTIRRFRDTINNIVTLSFLSGAINVGLLLGSLVLNATNILPMAVVWTPFISFWILIPFGFIGIILAVFDLYYLEKIEKKFTLNRDYRYWTSVKCDKIRNVCLKIAFWCLVFFLIYMCFWMISPLYSDIFVPEVIPNIVALKLLIADLFWIPLCITMVSSSWLNIFFINFGCYLSHNSHNNNNNNNNRIAGSMSDDATEDELLDFKLSRMGL